MSHLEQGLTTILNNCRRSREFFRSAAILGLSLKTSSSLITFSHQAHFFILRTARLLAKFFSTVAYPLS